MFEHKTFETIMQEMLDRVPDDVDKREGSIIWDALAPTAMDLAETYSDLDVIMRVTFADTSDGDYLERRVGEHGVYREEASFALRKGVFKDTAGIPMDVPVGSRYRLNDVVYVVAEKIDEGSYRLEANTPGSNGNSDFGGMVPVETVNGLGSAELTTVLIPGEDEETDESLYERFLLHINEPAFGGNRADYQKKIMSISGVGGVKLFRTPEGGGTVKAVVINSEYMPPEQELIETVQEIIDPTVNNGDGLGLAPIDHRVTIEGVTGVPIDIVTTLVLNDVSTGQVQSLIEEKIKEYLTETRKSWSGENKLIVRISQIESRILDVQGVQDIAGTKINGAIENLILTELQVPVFGSVTLHE